jgi:acetyltransferase-like isoleucine patch superfamily enzyme
MTELFRKLLSAPVKKLGIAILNRLERWRDADLPSFATEPKNLTIAWPRRIVAPERIYIGDDVWLGPGALLLAITKLPGPPLLPAGMTADYKQVFDSRITIGNRVTSTGRLTLGAHRDITVEDDVMFASNVTVSDALHGYETANTPYKYQPMIQIEPIVIKRGCWIGENVVIMPGVTIGELSIVGANSVVTKDIPARSIAVGAPARVIKRWDEASQQWGSVA